MVEAMIVAAKVVTMEVASVAVMMMVTMVVEIIILLKISSVDDRNIKQGC